MSDQWKCELCGFATDNDTTALRHHYEHRERKSSARSGLAVTEQDIVFLRVQGIRWIDDERE